jgi:hypothetical protein
MLTKKIAMMAALCCLSLFATAGAAHAQLGMQRSMPAFGGMFNPVVGSGADYDMTTSKGDQMTIQIGIVGKDTINGQPGYWMQMGMNGGKMKDGPMYIKMLSVVSGDQVTTTRMIMGIKGQAYQMPDQMIQMNSKPTNRDITASGTLVGPETITVPAGTFQTIHYKTKEGGDIWFMKDAGPWGLVKMHATDGTTMVMTKTYTDAKDMLTGPVKTFPGMSK